MKLIMLSIAMLALIPGLVAADQIINEKITIDLEYTDGDSDFDCYLSLKPENIDDRDDYLDLEWELEDPPDDDEWTFDVNVLVEDDEIDNRYDELVTTMTTHYDSMIGICEETKKGWLQADTCMNRAIEAEKELSSCNALLKTANDQAREKISESTNAEQTASECQNALDQQKKDYETCDDRIATMSRDLQDCNGEVAAATSDFEDAEKDRTIWGIAGLVLGAAAMHFLKKGGLGGGSGPPIERPGDEEGGF